MTLLVPSVGNRSADAQVTINYQTIQAEVRANFGPDQMRIDRFYQALERAKVSIEQNLALSTAILTIPVVFEAPQIPNAIASASDQTSMVTSWAAYRLAMINTAAGAPEGVEPGSETSLYGAFNPTSFQYRWAVSDTQPRTATSVVVPYALFQQLSLGPVIPPAPGAIKLRMLPLPFGMANENRRWSVYPGRAEDVDGFRFFSVEQVIVHETLHLLGYNTYADLPMESPPTSIVFATDAFRFADSAFPMTAQGAATGIRELRPTVDASLATSANGSGLPMSRGTRQGGDGSSAGHLRRADRLTPPVPIGVMQPGELIPNGVAFRDGYFTRRDWEGLDIIGWTVDINNLQFNVPNAQPNGIAPNNTRQRRKGISFNWIPDNLNPVDRQFVQLYARDSFGVMDEYDQFEIPDTTTSSFVLPPNITLPAGEYRWRVTALGTTAFSSADKLPFTVACAGDFNLDGFVGVQDIFDFLNAWFGLSLEADITGDGTVSAQDIFDFLNLWFGPC